MADKPQLKYGTFFVVQIKSQKFFKNLSFDLLTF
ncbi:MAG: hypothetical protein Q619_VDC00556G0015 [Veillonella dispar DORA_11]|uniref:Uncharacterized protein n=1 Tax=Veillonella dispar DORA_11 TaxID=1403949 RepID=W1V2R5_9FIRM|nr:MAG: hypothetical protein Q619_VDC00556G0015 [Veillonella dispar DORA_11]